MDPPNHTLKLHKHKYLNFEKCMIIQIRLKDDYFPYKITKELGRTSNFIRNKIARGIVTQIKNGYKVETYLADTEKNIHIQYRKHYWFKSDAYPVVTSFSTFVIQ